MAKPAIPTDAPSLIPSMGERALIVGSTGSGKTGFAAWMLRRLNYSPIVIYDTKEEKKFEALDNSKVFENFKDVAAEIKNGEADYIIFRPPVELSADAEAMDEYLMLHYQQFKNTPAYIDELYSFHSGGRAGSGLIAMLTRGRSRGITTIMATQRPAWISLFALTEAQKFYIFEINFKDDKKKLASIIAPYQEPPPPPKHGFYFFQQGDTKLTRYNPVKLDPGMNTGYTDVIDSSDASDKLKPKQWL